MTTAAGTYDVVIVGTGFSGIYALHLLRERGFSVRAIDAAGGVGGTWYWNRYPGARCDVETTDYQFGFDERIVRGWTWSERYAKQAEILAYLNYVTDLLDLRRDMQFDTRVVSALFDDAGDRWRLTTDAGEEIDARHCVLATGSLSASRIPDLPGLGSFAGPTYHTGRWPHGEVDFSGRRVAVIGTGSSGIQSIPVIAEQAEHVTVFQRTANFSVPALNRPRDPADEARMKATFMRDRDAAKWTTQGVFASWVANDVSALDVSEDERRAEFERRWAAGGFGFFESFSDLVTNREVNTFAADFARAKIREIVRDPTVAELLCPKDHPFASKRLCVDSDYHATFNRPNVALVDLRTTPLEAITRRGVRTTADEFPVDTIVFATGFDAMTGAVLAIDIRGRDGRRLTDAWAEGPVTYLGIQTAGFPNLFLITGPGSPSVLSNMISSIEQHVEWTSDCITYLRDNGHTTIEAEPAAQRDWVAHVNELASETLMPEADSWYVGANIPGKPRFFMPYTGGVGSYRRRADAIAAAGYRGFVVA
jgi:cyclohexanone monooxygenase